VTQGPAAEVDMEAIMRTDGWATVSLAVLRQWLSLRNCKACVAMRAVQCALVLHQDSEAPRLDEVDSQLGSLGRASAN
jgi:hypothetical protein